MVELKPICFIGARGGSKEIPLKNVRIIGGKPLITHTIESALSSGIFSSVIVSTEDARIARIAKKSGAEVPFIRPKKLATDSASMADVMVHGIRELEALGYNFDVFVNRDCTVPFIRNSDIRRSIRILRKTGCDQVVGVYRQYLNPYFDMVEADSKGYLRISKKKGKVPTDRQSVPIVYQLNGLWTYDKKKLLRYKKNLLPRTLPCEIPPETGFMIDTMFELEIAKLLFKARFFKM